MTLRLPEKWLWDFWLVQESGQFHIFYLQADRKLEKEALRHWNVSIGHAVSRDLKDWEILPDALHPAGPPAAGEAEAFDSYTTWTGSIIRHEKLWYMLYTGSRHSEDGLIQRVGLATSSDLLTWAKHPDNPVIEADPEWYELLDRSAWHDQAWRDPFVFRHPDTNDYHALITARSKNGTADARGVIGHARSSDLIHWTVLPPLTEPGEFGYLEVPQLVQIQGYYYLLFSCSHDMYSHARQKRLHSRLQTGTHYMVAENPLGPFRYLTDEFLVGDSHGSLYSGKLVQGPDQQWYFLAFRSFSPDGSFIGELSDPYPVEILPDGRLHVHIEEM